MIFWGESLSDQTGSEARKLSLLKSGWLSLGAERVVLGGHLETSVLFLNLGEYYMYEFTL
jgi:hypothetical protein